MIALHSPKNIKAHARAKLQHAPQMKQVMLVFCGIVLALCAVTTLIGGLVDARMENAGGLGNLGLRSVLSTVSTLLPFVNTFGLMVLELGLLAAALRVARRQYVSPNTLRLGLSRFFAMLRLTLLEVAAFLGLAVLCFNVGSTLFFMTPFANGMMELLEPLVTSGTAADPNALLELMTNDPTLTQRLFQSLIPLYLMVGLLYIAVVIPVSYKFRFAPYVLVNDPRAGAFRALFASWRLTRGCCIPLFKLDLSFWWYHVLLVLSVAVSYLYLIPGPLNSNVGMYLFYALYLISQLAIYYFFRARVEVSTALVFDSVCPQEKPAQGQVLGNIFQM